jgi:predicted ABC-type ATPase
MTPADELDHRREQFEALSTADGPLTPRSPSASVHQPDWYTDQGHATTMRLALHDRLLEEFRAEATEVPTERVAVVITGPPGAGKSSVRADILRETGTRPEQWRHIDPDAFRDRLLTAEHESGNVRRTVPLEAAHLMPTPRELSSQYFVESAKLTMRAQTSAVAAGENLMIEGVYSYPKRLDTLVKGLEKKGYTVHLANVDIRPDLALERTRARYRADAERASVLGVQVLGKDALGGRFVAAESLAGHFDDHGGSRATAATREVADRRQAVLSHRQYTVDGVDAPARLISVRHREHGLRPVDADSYQASRRGGAVSPMLGPPSERRIVPARADGAERPARATLAQPRREQDRER